MSFSSNFKQQQFPKVDLSQAPRDVVCPVCAIIFLASQDALEVIVWVSESHCWTELTDVTLVSEDTYWRLYWEALIINDTYGGDVREIVVLIMEVDKVVDEVTDMEIDM